MIVMFLSTEGECKLSIKKLVMRLHNILNQLRQLAFTELTDMKIEVCELGFTNTNFDWLCSRYAALLLAV